MKSLFVFIIVTFYCYWAQSQITLTTGSSTPVAGSEFTYIIDEVYSFSQHQSGANQTWDLSDISGNSSPSKYKTPSSSQSPGSFPQATIVEDFLQVETYYKYTSTDAVIEGNYAPGSFRVIYTDPREYLTFPITYGDKYNYTFDGTIENFAANQTFDRGGSTEIFADGYGKLILPYTTVDNVLRIRLTSEYEDQFSGIPFANYTDTVYLWYNLSNNTFIASASVLYVNGVQFSSSAFSIANVDLATGLVDEPNHTEHPYTIPTLSQGPIQVYNPLSEQIVITVYSISGQKILTTQLNPGVHPINLSSVSEGIYQLEYRSNTGVYTEKIMIQ